MSLESQEVAVLERIASQCEEDNAKIAQEVERLRANYINARLPHHVDILTRVEHLKKQEDLLRQDKKHLILELLSLSSELEDVSELYLNENDSSTKLALDQQDELAMLKSQHRRIMTAVVDILREGLRQIHEASQPLSPNEGGGTDRKRTCNLEVSIARVKDAIESSTMAEVTSTTASASSHKDHTQSASSFQGSPQKAGQLTSPATPPAPERPILTPALSKVTHREDSRGIDASIVPPHTPTPHRRGSRPQPPVLLGMSPFTDASQIQSQKDRAGARSVYAAKKAVGSKQSLRRARSAYGMRGSDSGGDHIVHTGGKEGGSDEENCPFTGARSHSDDDSIISSVTDSGANRARLGVLRSITTLLGATPTPQEQQLCEGGGHGSVASTGMSAGLTVDKIRAFNEAQEELAFTDSRD